MNKRNWKIVTFRMLRSLGILCKKPKPVRLVPRVQSTVYPAIPESYIKVQRFGYLYNKKSSYKNCIFDPDTETCACGITVDNFGRNGCSKIIK